MSVINRAKIFVYLDTLGVKEEHWMVGTADQVYAEAHDRMHQLALCYIADNDIEEPDEQDLIIDLAGFTIEWDDTPIVEVYTVVQSECSYDNVYGVYATRADAEEALFTECETWAYEVLMTDDPMDVLGKEEWDYKEDWKYLMRDSARCFDIWSTSAFDLVKEM